MGFSPCDRVVIVVPNCEVFTTLLVEHGNVTTKNGGEKTGVPVYGVTAETVTTKVFQTANVAEANTVSVLGEEKGFHVAETAPTLCSVSANGERKTAKPMTDLVGLTNVAGRGVLAEKHETV